MNATENNDYFINPDGLKIFKQIWYPKSKNNLRAVVYIIHGLSEHSSFYYEETLVNRFLECDCVVATHDHSGHGRSEGDRDVLESADKLARDVVLHIETVLNEIPSNYKNTIPVFLYGHSLGGLLACKVASDCPDFLSITRGGGLILEAPALAVNSAPNCITSTLGRLVLWFSPKYVLRRPVFSNLSFDPVVVEAASVDEYRNRNGLSLATALNISDAVFEIQERLKLIEVNSIFTAHGKQDPIVPYIASEIVIDKTDKVDSRNKIKILYDNAKHLLRASNDDVGNDFRDRVIYWLKERTTE